MASCPQAPAIGASATLAAQVRPAGRETGSPHLDAGSLRPRSSVEPLEGVACGAGQLTGANRRPHTAEPFAEEKLYLGEIERPVFRTWHVGQLLEQRDGVIVVGRGQRPGARGDQGQQ